MKKLLQNMKFKMEQDKQGQGSLIAIVLSSVILSTLATSATGWYLNMSKTMSGTEDRLEAMTIAMSEWQRLEHMSLDELETNRGNYKNPYAVGDKFKVGINLGEQGYFDNGTCNSLTGTYASENPNCFKNTTMTVYTKDGSALYTTRSLPLSVSQDSFPEGTILPYTGDLAKVPRGWVLCDGNNGTPDLTNRVLWGTKTQTGKFIEAGLPEISGSFKQWKFAGANGAFYNEGSWGGAQTKDGGGDPTYKVEFRASRASAIYGRSSTVQPPAYTVFYIMKTNKDFHYNHTNGAPTPNVYTKEQVDTLIRDKINEEKNYNKNTYLPINSYKYVHNLNESQWLGLKYDKDEDSIKGYVNGQEKQFGSKLGNEIIEEWHSADGLGYYRKYANGWVEQGGCVPQSPTIATYQTKVTLYVPFKNTNYIVLTQHQLPGYNYNTCSFDYILGNQKQITSFVIQTCSHFNNYYWRAEGFYK